MVAALLCAAASAIVARQQAFKTPDEAASALVSAAKAGDMKALVNRAGSRRRGHCVIRRRGRRCHRRARISSPPLMQSTDRHGRRQQGHHCHRTRRFPASDPAFPQRWHVALRHRGRTRRNSVRRIGKNELDAIQACLAYVDAQNEYAEKDRTGAGAGMYMLNASSASREKKTGFIGRHPKTKKQPTWRALRSGNGTGLPGRRRPSPFPRLLFQDPDEAGSRAPEGALIMSCEAR